MKYRALGILILAVIAFGCHRQPASESSPAGTDLIARRKAALSPLPIHPVTPEMAKIAKDAESEASRLRGLGFQNSVGLTQLTGWEYGARTAEITKILGGDQLEPLGRLATAGGILPEGTDLGSMAATFAAVSASASYSPLDKRVLLLTDFKEKPLLVHEFTHALQDQHFDLLKLLTSQPYDFDRAEAIFAVIEGDAMNVQRRSQEGVRYEKLPLDEIARQEGARFREYRESAGHLFQPLLTETFIFRYRDGAKFVEQVRRLNSEEGVNNLFLNPPLSSQQVLHFDKFLGNVAPVDVRVDDVALNRNGWQQVTSTPLGEIGIRGILMAKLAAPEASSIAEGWAGDRAYLFEQNGHIPLFIWKTTWRSESGAGGFFSSYEKLKKSLGEKGLEAVAQRSTWQKDGRLTRIIRDKMSVYILRSDQAGIESGSHSLGF